MNKLIFVSLMYLFFILVLHYGIKVQSLDISIPKENFENNTSETDLDFNELIPEQSNKPFDYTEMKNDLLQYLEDAAETDLGEKINPENVVGVSENEVTHSTSEFKTESSQSLFNDVIGYDDLDSQYAPIDF